MEFLRNNTRQAETGTTVVIGASLAEAYRKVRRRFGDEAVISGSRSRTRRKSSGWGTEQVVEVMVETGGAASLDCGVPLPVAGDLNAEIRYEVERLERMVADIVDPAPAPSPEPGPANPLGEFLIDNGASPGTVERLLTRFVGETGCARNDRPGALAWLDGYLRTGQEDLASLQGHHAFLCEHESDRLELVLETARRLHGEGRKVLVLAVLPDPDRDLSRLRNTAGETGHDAAVLRDADQLGDLSREIEGYDMVLLDMPSLNHPAMAQSGILHTWLAANTDVHRHLVVPMDRDFLDLGDLREAARSWNGDCLVLTRSGRTSRPAKLLDLLDAIPLPVSMVPGMGERAPGPLLAASEMLLDLILKTDGTDKGGQPQAPDPEK
jgi:hypothetical protein